MVITTVCICIPRNGIHAKLVRIASIPTAHILLTHLIAFFGYNRDPLVEQINYNLKGN
jgi:hypothetical protein